MIELIDPDSFAVVHVLSIHVAYMLSDLLDCIFKNLGVLTSDLYVAYLEVLDVLIIFDVI